MGEKMNFTQLNTVMDTATDSGTMRRITFGRFEEVCRHPVAWNELDMLPCHADLLQQQGDEVCAPRRKIATRPFLLLLLLAAANDCGG